MTQSTAFITPDFMLHNEVARILYHDYAKSQPIFDYHNHLSPKDIAEDRQFENITQLWIEGDHYKWRGMRANGIDEEFITGSASLEKRFQIGQDPCRAGDQHADPCRTKHDAEQDQQAVARHQAEGDDRDGDAGHGIGHRKGQQDRGAKHGHHQRDQALGPFGCQKQEARVGDFFEPAEPFAPKARHSRQALFTDHPRAEFFREPWLIPTGEHL